MTLKGSRVALEKFQQFWVEAEKCNKDFKLIDKQLATDADDDSDALLEPFTCSGFKSDVIFHTLRNRMHEEEDIVRKLSGIMRFEITRNGSQSIWSNVTLFSLLELMRSVPRSAIDFTKPLGQNVYPGPSIESPVCVLTMADEDFVKMMVNKLNPQKVSNNRLTQTNESLDSRLS